MASNYIKFVQTRDVVNLAQDRLYGLRSRMSENNPDVPLDIMIISFLETLAIHCYFENTMLLSWTC